MAHYMRQRHTGDPETKVSRIIGNDLARFWSHVDQRGPDECWPWTGGDVNSQGYGRIKTKERYWFATRYYIAVVLGEPLADGQEVCHRCDNPPCMNRAHLFVSDHLGNMRDMDTKGRCQRARGEEQGQHKLTEGQVREIRRRHMSHSRTASYTALAAEFGVHKATIGRIVTRKAWKHI